MIMSMISDLETLGSVADCKAQAAKRAWPKIPSSPFFLPLFFGSFLVEGSCAPGSYQNQNANVTLYLEQVSSSYKTSRPRSPCGFAMSDVLHSSSTGTAASWRSPR